MERREGNPENSMWALLPHDLFLGTITQKVNKKKHLQGVIRSYLLLYMVIPLGVTRKPRSERLAERQPKLPVVPDRSRDRAGHWSQ